MLSRIACAEFWRLVCLRQLLLDAAIGDHGEDVGIRAATELAAERVFLGS